MTLGQAIGVCLYALGIVSLLILVAAVVTWVIFDGREQRRAQDHRVLLAHDWQTPDLEETT